MRPKCWKHFSGGSPSISEGENIRAQQSDESSDQIVLLSTHFLAHPPPPPKVDGLDIDDLAGRDVEGDHRAKFVETLDTACAGIHMQQA